MHPERSLLKPGLQPPPPPLPSSRFALCLASPLPCGDRESAPKATAWWAEKPWLDSQYCMSQHGGLCTQEVETSGSQGHQLHSRYKAHLVHERRGRGFREEKRGEGNGRERERASGASRKREEYSGWEVRSSALLSGRSAASYVCLHWLSCGATGWF